MTRQWKYLNSAVNEASPLALVELFQPMWSCSPLKLSIDKYIFNTTLSANRHDSLLFQIEHQRIFGQSERDRVEGHRTWCRYQSTYCCNGGTVSDSTSNDRSETKPSRRLCSFPVGWTIIRYGNHRYDSFTKFDNRTKHSRMNTARWNLNRRSGRLF